jgi:S1-C subfamily serine protease
MEPTSGYRPRVSRETRLLLTAGLLAITVLWLLARVRFRDRPAPPSAIPAVLSQLTAKPTLDDVAAEIGELASRLAPSLVAIEWPSNDHGGQPGQMAGLLYRDDLAVTRLHASPRSDAPGVVAVDRASGLAVLRTPGRRAGTPPTAWARRGLQGPRYLFATDVSPAGVSLRPVFIGSLTPMATPLWADALWVVPVNSDVSVGSLLFTRDAELVGLVISVGGQRAVVPSQTLLAEADRLLARPERPAGTLGIGIQPMTVAVREATGVSAGLVIASVDRSGPATGGLNVGDVIESIDGRSVTDRVDWDVRMARLSAGDTVTVRGRSHGRVVEAALVAMPSAPAATRTLGLILRPRPQLGVEVVRLERGSAAERAGLVVGDVITVFGEIVAPTPNQMNRAFAALPSGKAVIVGVTRGDVHFVTALER